MSARQEVLTGDDLLVAVADAMVEFHQRYHNRTPVLAKALLLGDALLACVLGDLYGDVVTTLTDLQDATILQETRSPFQEEMQDRFIAEIERLSGRGVQAFISNSHVDPELEIELFMLKPTNGPASTRRPASRGYAFAWERRAE
jgi:Na+-translocating membrane potential-generating system (MpsC)